MCNTATANASPIPPFREVPNIAYLRYRTELLFGKLPVTSTPYNWKDVGWDGGHPHYVNQVAPTLTSPYRIFNTRERPGCTMVP